MRDYTITLSTGAGLGSAYTAIVVRAESGRAAFAAAQRHPHARGLFIVGVHRTP